MAREPIHIRLDDGLRVQLAQMAAQEHRSLSNMIELILMQYLGAKPVPKTAVNGHDHKAAKPTR